MAYVAFVLAAGRSRRMNSSLPKLLFPLAGQPLLNYSLAAARQWAHEDVYCVLSPETNDLLLQSPLREPYHTVIQESPQGTGHAFKAAFEKAQEKDPFLLDKWIFILLGDAPLVRAQDLEGLVKTVDAQGAQAALIGMRPPCPGPYGRLVVDPAREGKLLSIVEAADASCEHLKIDLCNTGVMLIQAAQVPALLAQLKPSPHTGEYYLTDLIGLIPEVAVVEGPWEAFVGINTRQQLCEAEHLMQDRLRHQALERGVFLLAPETTYLSYDTQMASEVVIHPFTTFGPGVVLEEGATVFSFSVLADCRVQAKAKVGPFAHVRAGASLEPYSQAGSFVEVKNTTLGYASQAKHLSYLGDAVIGSSVNIGAGVVICNYDGFSKHPTTIGSGTLIGGNASLIAPLAIGEDVTIGAGSVISKEVPSATLAVSRKEQRNIPLPAHSRHLRRKRKDCSAPQN